MKQLKPDLRMLLLILGSLKEQRCDLLIPVLLRLGSVIGILIPRFGFSGKCRHQISFCLCAFQTLLHVLSLLYLSLRKQLYCFEHILANSADRTDIIVRKLFKRNLSVILIMADSTDVLL